MLVISFTIHERPQNGKGPSRLNVPITGLDKEANKYSSAAVGNLSLVIRSVVARANHYQADP